MLPAKLTAARVSISRHHRSEGGGSMLGKSHRFKKGVVEGAAWDFALGCSLAWIIYASKVIVYA